MTDQTLDPLPEVGEPIDVRIDGTIADGVFRVDVGIEDLALVTLTFNDSGALLLNSLLDVAKDNWALYRDRLVQAYLEAKQAEEAAEGVQGV